MKRKISKFIVFGIIICLSFAFAFVGCKDPLDDFKRDKVTSEEWKTAFDAIYTSFNGMVGKNFKIEISTEKEVPDNENIEYLSYELTAISCGEKEYCKEKRVERKTLSNGEVVLESVTFSEKYLERAQEGAFEYVFENGEWIKKKSEAAYGSIVFERVSSYNEQYRELFTQFLPDYDKDKGGYYNGSVWTSDIHESMSCVYKMKEKRVASILANNRIRHWGYEEVGEENILFLYDYGKQEITLPK